MRMSLRCLGVEMNSRKPPKDPYVAESFGLRSVGQWPGHAGKQWIPNVPWLLQLAVQTTVDFLFFFIIYSIYKWIGIETSWTSMDISKSEYPEYLWVSYVHRRFICIQLWLHHREQGGIFLGMYSRLPSSGFCLGASFCLLTKLMAYRFLGLTNGRKLSLQTNCYRRSLG